MNEPSHDERSVRIDKLQRLRKTGIEPYPSHVNRTHKLSEALDQFESLSAAGTEVSLAGRIRLLRRHGGLSFARIEDDGGVIQLLLSKKGLGESPYALTKELDLADFISASGKLILSKTGEKTLEVSSWQLISKAILPLPEKWHGLKNEEERYRHRYLDLIVNPEVRDFFRLRSKFISSMRAFLTKQGFMEVETPVLEHVPGGAEAEPFITHHNTLDVDLYLRISLELHLKRLIVGGYEKIFEIGKVFRNEGMSTQHLQEFTEMEFYWAYADNEKLMQLVQELYQTVIKETFGSLKITCRDIELDFSGNWPKYDYSQLVLDHAGIDLKAIETATQLQKAIKSAKIKLDIDPKAG